jgi:hypothetical protein
MKFITYSGLIQKVTEDDDFHAFCLEILQVVKLNYP